MLFGLVSSKKEQEAKTEEEVKKQTLLEMVAPYTTPENGAKVMSKEEFKERLAEKPALMEVEMPARESLERQYLDSQYPQLNPGFLAKRHDNGTPVFAAFTLKNPVCLVHSHRYLKGWAHGDPKGQSPWEQLGLPNYHGDAIIVDSASWAKMTFLGIIPERVKRRIEQVKPDFDDFLIITATTPETWEVIKPIIDPLVIGVRRFKYLEPRLSVVALFDALPAERYVLAEHCTGPEK